MKTYQLSDEDAAQVRAILLTHAEMQDQRALQNEELRGRLSTEQDEEVDDTIEDLEDAHTDLEDDRNNLQRIAAIFE